MAYDYIIVGGGSAGCVLANRLSEDPSITVLLIEAGGPDTNMLFRMPAGFAKMTKGIASWGWSTVPQKHLNGRVIWYTQAKVIGGGSSINAQLYTRGNAKDYDAWETEAGCEGWSYRDVLPYFKRAEDNQRLVNNYHGYGGPLGVSYPINPPPISFAFLRAAQEAGLPFNDDFNGAVQEGIGHYQLTTRNAERSSTASAYLGPVRSRQNLTVRLNTPTLKILVENRRAVGVEVGIAGRIETLRAEREVILSSGAIGSPRLLQLSGIGPADALAAPGSPSFTLCQASVPICRIISISTQFANAPAITPTIAWRSRIVLSGRGCNICCSRPAPSRRHCSRREGSGTRTGRRARRIFNFISGSDPASRQASRRCAIPALR